jgi:uncharacterized protein YjgD (DUF1641 family)
MSDPDIAALLTQILERMDRLEARIDAIQGTTESVAQLGTRGPAFVEMVAESATYAYNQARDAGVDPIRTGEQGAALALKACAPEALRAVERILDRQALLHRTLDVVDALDADGSLDTLLDKGGEIAPRVARIMESPPFDQLVNSGLLNSHTLRVVSNATTALVDTRSSGLGPLGLFGQLRALRDADVQRAVGFSLSVARRFGQLLA